MCSYNTVIMVAEGSTVSDRLKNTNRVSDVCL